MTFSAKPSRTDDQRDCAPFAQMETELGAKKCACGKLRAKQNALGNQPCRAALLLQSKTRLVFAKSAADR
jgi:hypothetical protein